ncbi:hypothetical protein F2P81_012447 [Scophthalmus maximus]|uniref:Uncharacterized protein n=1 Tax=Scophthalmus maximus TaxID=52904 RepID=A0A6A4SPN0_SCOMX|nr:hypothetical protein F2P81_012447 [Scophthalmus maximus]
MTRTERLVSELRSCCTDEGETRTLSAPHADLCGTAQPLSNLQLVRLSRLHRLPWYRRCNNRREGQMNKDTTGRRGNERTLKLSGSSTVRTCPARRCFADGAQLDRNFGFSWSNRQRVRGDLRMTFIMTVIRSRTRSNGDVLGGAVVRNSDLSAYNYTKDFEEKQLHQTLKNTSQISGHCPETLPRILFLCSR